MREIINVERISSCLKWMRSSKNFLAQKKIAVVGVSDKRETGCNAGYKRFKEAGYTVYAVNPRITTFRARRATRI